ncbi:hypothetical protein NL676_007566 [Syzygium grande]|nr:hypothetical protein NL676_007566 [Syzygium grande]
MGRTSIEPSSIATPKLVLLPPANARDFWTENEERNRYDTKVDCDKFWVFRFFARLLVPELFAGVTRDPAGAFLICLLVLAPAD